MPPMYPVQSAQVMMTPNAGFAPHLMAHSTPQVAASFQTTPNIQNLNPANQHQVPIQMTNQGELPVGGNLSESSMPTTQVGGAAGSDGPCATNSDIVVGAVATNKSSLSLTEAATEKARDISVSREQNRQISMLLAELDAANDLNKEVYYTCIIARLVS